MFEEIASVTHEMVVENDVGGRQWEAVPHGGLSVWLTRISRRIVPAR